LTRETEKSEKKHQLQIGFSRRFFSFLSFSENKKGRDDITLQLCKSFRHAMLFGSSTVGAPSTRPKRAESRRQFDFGAFFFVSITSS
jgi:hypothetical protein